LSRPFFFIRNGVVFFIRKGVEFIRKGVEFAAGLARLPEKGLLISFGVGDGEAWSATVEASEVRRLLYDAEQSPSERPKSAAGTSKTETSSGDIARMRQEIDRPKVAKRQPGALAISRTSVRTAKLRFFSECRNASEDKGYHRNFRAGNPAL
jgi:hypothetical protein